MIAQHITFESYYPESCTESGTTIMERSSVQFSGQDLSINDLLDKFEDFLRCSGYAACLKNKRVGLIDPND